ncbi:hypothetical protein Tco_0435521 [Tanacetum coccineum]
MVVNSSVDENTYVKVNSSVIMNDYVNYVEMCNKCLELEVELIKQHNMVKKDEYNRLLKRFSKLEQHCISLEIAMQLNKEIFQKTNTSVNQTEPSFDQLFELNNLKAEIQAKDMTIKKLKAHIKHINETSTSETLKNDLRKLKGKDIVANVAQMLNASIIAPKMYKLNPVILSLKVKNNRKAHEYYLKHTMEQAAILKEVVKQAKSQNPLDSASYLACMCQALCSVCNECLFDVNHAICLIAHVNSMNVRNKSASKKNKKRKEWKPTGKVFNSVGYKWKPTRRTFTLVRNVCPLTRITTTNKVPLRVPIPLDVVAPEHVVTRVYTRRPNVPKSVPNSKPKVEKSDC